MKHDKLASRLTILCNLVKAENKVKDCVEAIKDSWNCDSYETLELRCNALKIAKAELESIKVELMLFDKEFKPNTLEA